MAVNNTSSNHDADWAQYAARHGFSCPSEQDYHPFESISTATLDISSSRAAQLISQTEWTKSHPLSMKGYKSHLLTVETSDGARVDVKVSWPSKDHSLGEIAHRALPVMFVTHGGGWIQGTHVSEEQWILWPLYDLGSLVIVSVEYRLAPEHEFPTWIEDSWDVLQRMLLEGSTFLPTTEVEIDTRNVLLAGSSAGAGIAAVLSQRCRDHNISIKCIVLNVPVLCDYRHLPLDELRQLNNGGHISYEQFTAALLDSGTMKAVWELVIPSSTMGRQPIASPLLGDLHNLAPHLIFVAGQDPLRDEGLAYASRLRNLNVPVTLYSYPGVPHTFSEFHELSATQKFWTDIRSSISALLSQ